MLWDCQWVKYAPSSTSSLAKSVMMPCYFIPCWRRHTANTTRWHVPQAVQTLSCSLIININTQGTVIWIWFFFEAKPVKVTLLLFPNFGVWHKKTEQFFQGPKWNRWSSVFLQIRLLQGILYTTITIKAETILSWEVLQLLFWGSQSHES